MYLSQRINPGHLKVSLYGNWCIRGVNHSKKSRTYFQKSQKVTEKSKSHT